MKRFAAAIVLLCFFAVLFAESETKISNSLDISAVAQIAMTTPDYPVTAGDVYDLVYAASGQSVSYTILVDSSYKIKVSNLGVIDVSGMTFLDLKKQVETIVSKNYPFSGVQFVLKMPAMFNVVCKGEVRETTEVAIGALTRLSSIVDGVITSYGSIRDVKVQSRSGKTVTYDIFKAKRLGDLSQNPYLRPGDTIIISRVHAIVSIEGEVERPGTYQLLPGEGLSDLVTLYASGFTPYANTEKIDLNRVYDSAALTGERIYLTKTNIAENYPLRNRDAVSVSRITDLRPVMYLQGALQVPSTDKESVNVKTGLVGSANIPIQFTVGESYASLVRRSKAYFYASSDTAHAYIMRKDQKIPVNVNPMLFDTDFRSDLLVEENDILVIPFNQLFVTVTGAVVVPGRYPYIPGRDWSYYVTLAGGVNPQQNSNESVSITDILGKKHTKADIITPETVIKAEFNAFVFNFNFWAPVVTTTLTALYTYFLVMSLIK